MMHFYCQGDLLHQHREREFQDAALRNAALAKSRAERGLRRQERRLARLSARLAEVRATTLRGAAS